MDGRCTGPKTVAGKAKSAMNALKHGLAAKTPLIPGEDEEEFRQFVWDIVEDLRPEGPVQAELAQRVAVLMWKRRRLAGAEEQALCQLRERYAERTARRLAELEEAATTDEDLEALEEEKAKEQENGARWDANQVLADQFGFKPGGLDRLARYETPLHVTPGVERYFRDISRDYPGERRRWLENVHAALTDPRAREWILSDVYWNAILRNTISLTGLQGSNKTNVIPAEASADVDIRLLPDQDPDSVLATLKKVVADSAVTFTPLIVPKAPFESSTSSEFFRAVERVSRERDPGAFVTSSMLTGATDRPMYRQLGIQVYGLDPFRTNDVEWQRGVHGNDERISVASFLSGIRFVFEVLRNMQ